MRSTEIRSEKERLDPDFWSITHYPDDKLVRVDVGSKYMIFKEKSFSENILKLNAEHLS